MSKNRLFPGVKKNEISTKELDVLINIMIEKGLKSAPMDSNIPAGFTYIGQLIAHDIVKSTSGKDDRTFEVRAMLELDSIYGNEQYRVNNCNVVNNQFIFNNPYDDFKNKFNNMDLLRKNGKVIIPDKRNDENYIISQLHIFWQKYHNKIVDSQLFKINCKNMNKSKQFDFAKSVVVKTFQQVVIEDFLYNILDFDIYKCYINRIQSNKDLFFYKGSNKASEIPLEFSHAGFRFGHSMVRKSYKVNDDNINALNLCDLFNPCHKPISINQIVDWRRFFNLKVKDTDNIFAELIDDIIVNPMSNIPDQKHSIIRLNMQAGFNVELPSGIQILNEIRKNKSLALELKLDKGNYIPIDYTNVEYKPYLDAVNQDENKIPLWLYILLEAKTQATRYNDGLGKLGSVIVAEVILQVIKQSENTIFENNIINPIDFNILNRASIELLRCASKPEEIYLGLLYDFRRFKMTDLINFIN